MSDTVGKLVIGLGLASTVSSDGEKAKAEARKLKKEMDKIFITPSHSPSTQPLTHMADSGQWKRYSDAIRRQTQADKYASMEMFGTPAMGALANMPRSAFVSMAMGSWEKNRGIQLRSQIQVADEISRREARLTKEAERVRLKEIARKNQEWREAQRQQSNAARMDPANNLRRGFVGGMFGSPVGAASTIGGVAAVGALAGFVGGMAARAVSSGFHMIERSVIGLGRETIKTASDIEMLRLRLDTITNGKGLKFFDQLYEAAIDLRAPVEGMIKSFSKMTAMGFQPTMEQLKGLVNYTRMLGDPENLDYIVLAFSQIASKGKLEMQELRQLAERGLPALSIIQQKLNIPMNKIGDIGKLFIPGGKVVKALLDEIMVRTGDIQEKYKRTMAGMIDYTKLLWFQFKKEIGESGVYDSFKSLLSELIRVMESPGFHNAAKDIGNVFSGLLQGLQKTVSFMTANKDTIIPLFKYLGIPIGGAHVGALIGAGVGALTLNPAGVAAGAAAGAVIGAGTGAGAVGAYDLAEYMGGRGPSQRPEMSAEFKKIELDIDTTKLRKEMTAQFFKSIMSGLDSVVDSLHGFFEGLAKGIDNLPETMAELAKRGLIAAKNTIGEAINAPFKNLMQGPQALANMVYGVGGKGSNKGLRTDKDVNEEKTRNYVDRLDKLNKAIETERNNWLNYLVFETDANNAIARKYGEGTTKIRADVYKFFDKQEKDALQQPEGVWRDRAMAKTQMDKDEMVIKEFTDYFSEFTRDMANATVSSMKSFQDALAEVTMDPFSLSVRKIKEQAKAFGKLDPAVQKKLDDMVKAGDISQYEADRRKREMLPSQDQLDFFVKNAVGKLTPTQWESPVAGSQATRQSMFGIGNPMATVASNTTKQLELTKQGNEQSKLILNAMLATGTGDLLTDQSVLDILLQ